MIVHSDQEACGKMKLLLFISDVSRSRDQSDAFIAEGLQMVQGTAREVPFSWLTFTFCNEGVPSNVRGEKINQLFSRLARFRHGCPDKDTLRR